jgi:hypothetical protein
MASNSILLRLILTAVSATAATAPQPQHYFVRIPQSQMGCQEEAKAMASRFTRATSLRVIEAKCVDTVQLPAEGKTYPLYSLDLTYLAPSALTPEGAVFGDGEYSANPRNSTGAYRTFDECLADLPTQSTVFETQTRLRVVTATCEPARIMLDPSYVLRIESFGAPAKRLYTVAFDFYGQADADFRAKAADLVTQSGGTLARIWANNILYYAKLPVPVRYRRISSFAKASECEVQLDEMHSIFGNNGASHLIAGCLPVAGDLFKGWVSMEGVDDGGELIQSDFGLHAPKYYAFDECMRDRKRVLQDMAAQGRNGLLGGICHADNFVSHQIVLEIFEHL